MKLENSRAGVLKSMETGYDCFIPHALKDIKIVLDDELTHLLYKAYLLLGKLDGVAVTLPDVDLFVSMYVQKEAVISSQIEGTQASLTDVLQKDKCVEKIQETEEIVNYIKAMKYAFKRLEDFPLCNRLIKEIHSVLLSGVRGKEKSPGEFRRSQNWIAYAGCNLKTASYVPPAPEYMKIALSDLEKYMNDYRDSNSNSDSQNNKVSGLLKIALIHYQFESIHPFLDGNGRVGRLLIILFLKEIGLIEHPVLYLSYFFKQNRDKYYDLLMNVRLKGEFEPWLKFFIQGICEVAENSINSIQKILELNKRDRAKISSAKKGNVSELLLVYDYLLKHPFVIGESIKEVLDVSEPTRNKRLETLRALGILQLVENKKRYKKFVYTEYVDILSEGAEL